MGLVERGTPTIVVDRELDDLAVSQVMVANHDGGRLAGQHLLKLGHRDIGVIAGPGNLGTSARRLDGLQAALTEAGLTLSPDRVWRGDFRAISGRAAMEHWLERGRLPTAIFAENDLMAIGALSAAHAAGLDVPTELTVVGFDGIAFGADVTPPLTTVSQSADAMATAATELLMERLRSGQAAPRKVELPVSLLVRGSTAEPAARRA